MRLLVLAALLALLPATVSAHHVRVVQSDPPATARLPGSPRAVLVLFDQPLAMPGSGLAVTDARGVRHDRGGTTRGEVDRASLAVDLPPLPAGQYTVTWRVTSEADGEFNQGTFDFTVLPKLGSLWPDQAQLGALGLVILTLGALFMFGGDRRRHNRGQ